MSGLAGQGLTALATFPSARRGRRRPVLTLFAAHPGLASVEQLQAAAGDGDARPNLSSLRVQIGRARQRLDRTDAIMCVRGAGYVLSDAAAAKVKIIMRGWHGEGKD